MGLLTEAMHEQAFLKAGMLGFPGSGKTYTACMLAIGITKKLGAKKPVAFFDTETGSDFLIPRFKAEGIQLLRLKSQAFTDLLTVAREAEKECSVLIVDSISHVWRELCQSYQNKRKISRLSFQHWGDIKKEWAVWTNLYLNSKLHIFVLGRAGYEYDMEANEEGKKELIKVGTKMKVETEFGFEPSLLIEMERVAKGIEPGSGWLHRAHILKDRTDTINGKAFDFQKPSQSYKPGDWQQTFKPFSPVFEALNIGGEHVGIDAERTSEAMFERGESRGDWHRRREILLEELQASLVMIWPGQDVISKTAKLSTIDTLYNTRSWKELESRTVEELELGYKILKRLENSFANLDVKDVEEMTSAIKTLIEKEAMHQ